MAPRSSLALPQRISAPKVSGTSHLNFEKLYLCQTSPTVRFSILTNIFHKFHLSDLLYLNMPQDAKILHFKGFKGRMHNFKEDKFSKN